MGGCSEGQSVQRAPHPQHSASEAAKPEDLGSIDPGRPTRVGNSVSSHRQPPSPCNANPPRAGGAELPAKAQARRPQERTGLRRWGSVALRWLPPLAPSRLLSLPRRLQHRAAEAHGRRKPEEGGARVRSGAGKIGLPRPGGGAGESAVPPAVRGARQPVRCPRGPGPVPRRLCASEPRGSSSCWAAGARWAVAAAAPKFAEEGAMRRGRLWSSGSPERRGRSAAELLPFGVGGHPPRALAGRPGEENHHEGRAGEKQLVASGQAILGLLDLQSHVLKEEATHYSYVMLVLLHCH
ncbi:PREDICTED: uncharacterized protein LOC109377047 [Hipposideros armiger]|uniref:Uncharacterized protein LOC109377047 n=1 Tax=Hipposideros armiger TaxID=186990 RepID=A0A8B7QJP2_HIPAR|nr:PREDICTED: uncharacterized protein LOC109377047 [Hipposideros armiger]